MLLYIVGSPIESLTQGLFGELQSREFSKEELLSKSLFVEDNLNRTSI